jgi:hypothetical protein
MSHPDPTERPPAAEGAGYRLHAAGRCGCERILAPAPPVTAAERAERFEQEARTFEAQAIENWNLAKAADGRAELADYFRHAYEKMSEQVKHLEAERAALLRERDERMPPPTAAERAALDAIERDHYRRTDDGLPDVWWCACGDGAWCPALTVVEMARRFIGGADAE